MLSKWVMSPANLNTFTFIYLNSLHRAISPSVIQTSDLWNPQLKLRSGDQSFKIRHLKPLLIV
jgi:hypothetical protein